ncbi:MAG: membrane protein insertion efficiency factor YidD [Desulfuromonas sp.]|nr:membrane protein insertion efficiency factor YidD [Desulfuromonas sp.]
MVLAGQLATPVGSHADSWQPWQVATSATKKHQHQHSNDDPLELNPLVQGVRFFQRYISVVDSPRCPMYPTCSTYALQAMDKHGPLLGMFITVDRLLHETNPLEQTIPLHGYERERFYDPLSNNDFWLDD